MRYVALLRGINVGGGRKVPMAQLKLLFEDLGFSGVSTYINSGNILFDSGDPAEKSCKDIERIIESTFGFAVPTLVMPMRAFQAIAEQVPSSWTNDTLWKTDVIFLWPDIDSNDILQKIKIKPEIEKVKYIPGALVWHISRKFVTRGSMIKLVQSEFYSKMTIRNINTVRKLVTR